MAKTIKCPICGLEFTTSRPNKKYCSFTCKEAGHKLQRLKWEDKNPGYNRSYMQAYRKKDKTAVLVGTLVKEGENFND